MRLSKIKLAGFKSFVDPTTILLPSNRVGIVGPNGCGKSNTIDAVRWVMGESSARYLRGDSMEDVIFNGSSTRKPVGQAAIELVFDNSQGVLGGQYAQYAEISIRRRVSRDGQSQYFLNGTRCRRRDITDIFLGTGLGPRSYAIIEQGMISRIIEARPEELRVYLEEAAGISRYKERRRETETRIRHTRENLERLQDLRDEVDKQLRHLQRQADVAERYKAWREDERRLKAELMALRLRDLEAEAERRGQELRVQETRLEATVARQRQQEAGLEQDRAALVDANEAFNEVQGRYYRLGSEISRTEQSIQHHRELRERQSRELAQVRDSLAQARGHIQDDEARLVAALTDLEALEPEHAVGSEALEEISDRLMQAEQAMMSWQGHWEDFNRRAAEPSQVAQVERTRMEQLERQIRALDDRLGRLTQEQEDLSTDALRAEIQVLAEQSVLAHAGVETLDEALQAVRDRIHDNREQARLHNAQVDELRRRIQSLNGRLASLEALQQAALGKQTASVTGWLKAQGLADAPRLGEGLDVAAGWEKAVETVLGQYLEAICVPDLDPLAQVCDSLEEGDLLAWETVGGDLTDAMPDSERLSTKVRGPIPLNDLLTPVHAAPDLETALVLRARLAPHESVITPDGIWLGRCWLRVARDRDEHAGLIGRDRELRQLRDEMHDLQEELEIRQQGLEDGREGLRELEAGRDQVQVELNQAHRAASELDAQLSNRRTRLEQVETRMQRVEGEITEVQAQRLQEHEALQQATHRRNEAVTRMEALARERDSLERGRDGLRRDLDMIRGEARSRREAVHQMALKLQTLRAARDAARQALDRLQGQSAQLQARLEYLQIALDDAEAPIGELEDTLVTLVDDRMDVEQALAAARARVQALEAEMRDKDQHRLGAEREADTLRDRLDQLRMAWQEIKVRRQTVLEQLEEAGFTLASLLAAMDPAATVADRQAQADALGQRIARLGPINLAAIDEYKAQSERQTYLDAQYNDLTQALETLESAIQRIDRETRSRFRDTFERVNGRLQEMFPRLFGGGQAHLEMTGDDLLSTGIAVMARPPGKRLSTIHLMSGGEKALTAVALVFAIFELNPAPFCMLDEVDAPLDEANVGRFCALVREMSERVQFIFITHNKTTMELADQLVGVTMREPGVSRLVTVDVEEAAQMATT
ncbi:chromosome segregation protein SMC [Ectothiorhodospira lacustris]|uniref:chromosome segregation protein SMC n=1 Tax=Ectothiorhodospira lacustris TaxID=2899127 RepID=UPI001EE9AEC3|nr:chromosome segregation protein SMC [Ectothiorhodospira lacustris]MCG5511048.1 chromosome segregation protein SMC [Ectothiorhodospira lacustris]MCG5522778.1 chromosome segregation protein SMC [Ectothiorhodospira lacustris]